MTLKAEQVRRLLSYDPASGVFRWRVRPANCVQVGDIAGAVHHSGYVVVSIKHQKYAAHRLAWLHVHGVWPKAPLDHVNGDKRDNRIANLRLSTPALNAQNMRKPVRGAAVPLLGVCFHKQTRKYQAAIRVGGKPKHLGLFTTPEAAHEAYVAAKRKFHEGNTL